MQFKLWLEYKESDAEIKIDAFIKKIKNIVISSIYMFPLDMRLPLESGRLNLFLYLVHQ